jgi:hypothetical protein
MFVVIWEFEPLASRVADFEDCYGPAGQWSRLFQNSPQYLGTELLRDSSRSGRFLTIDRWASREGYEQLLVQHKAEYELLDRACDALTKRESLIGRFHFP